jgi:hypothetical protein
MDKRHREAVAPRFAMHTHATNRKQQITRDLSKIWHRFRAGRARDVLVRAPQANCEKPIRAIVLCGNAPAKATIFSVAGLDRTGRSRHG